MIEISDATTEEAPLVRRIMLEAFAEYMGVLTPPSSSHAETEEDVRRAIAEGGAVVSRLDGLPVGVARYTFREGRLYVGRVAVLPAFRRRGIASAIMARMEEIARERSMPLIEVGVRLSLPGNLALYQRLGYEIVEINPHPRGPDHTVIMVKRI